VGLIHGITNFDPQRGFRISTYVLTRINGQILHFRRDRQHTLRIPWRLKDLYRRGMRLQAQRLQQGLEPLDERGLAAALNMSPQRWRESLIAHALGHVDSLDVVPAMQGLGGEQRSSLMNQIEDPSSRPVSLEDPTLCWLQDALKTLEPQQRCWLLARYVDNISIKDLALRERVSPGLLRQSIRTSLSLLRQAARAQQHGLQQHGLQSASKTQWEGDQHR
jgi:RNA polymerase sigma-B factor